MNEAPVKLSERQEQLLERACLKRYTVVFEHYMGSWHPTESVYVEEDGQRADRSFRASTVRTMGEKNLVRLVSQGAGISHVLPTGVGLELFKRMRDAKAKS